MKTRENKPHIGIFGKRNQGKSSFINTLTGQEIAIVSNVAGTTTDAVKKSIEIKNIGPVIMIDTAGLDDTSPLGKKRVQKTMKILQEIDLAILIFSNNKFTETDEKLVEQFKRNYIPFFIVHNKSDVSPIRKEIKNKLDHFSDVIDFSCVKTKNLNLVFDLIKKHLPSSAYTAPSLFGNLINYGDIVLLITPIDSEAPEGRLILPQVQAIRDILDNDAIAIVLKEREVDIFLKKTNIIPALAVTDSQVFLKAAASIPEKVPLTGFSVLLAHYKGDFDTYLSGTPHISKLKDGDKVLMLESCTHQVSCDDIGRVKLPRWISNFTGKKLKFDIVSGLNDLPEKLTDYSLVIQCGGCMITRRQLINRIRPAIQAGVPVTNYGLAIAYVQGIYERAIAPFTSNKSSQLYL